MQFGRLGKLVAAGTIGAIMAGSTVAFAQLQNYPAPFVSGGSANTVIVVGAAAKPSDVVGAVDLAVRLGGEATTDVNVAGTIGGLSISGEGREISTTNTKLFLADNLGKTGVRSTMTRDDMPTLLANGILDDADASTTHNYQQFIYLTPQGSAAQYRIDFEKPGSSSSVDPTYSLGRFPTSPVFNDYLYKTYITFDKEVQDGTSVGEKMTLFGNEYTISSGTNFSASPAKLVLFGGAQSTVLAGGETTTATVSGSSYDISFVGASSATQAVVKVGTDQQSITKGSSKKVGGLDVYVDDVYYLSQNDQTQNSAKLLLGSAKITLQHGSKVKLGDTEDSVDGTMVNLTTSSNKLSALTIYTGGRSSNEDYLALGGTYMDPVWKTFSLAFPSVSPGMMDASRSKIDVKPSGDNVLQLTFTDDRGNTKTIDWAYKALSTDTTLRLGDSSGNNWIIKEGAPIRKDNLFVVDAGDFTHLYKLTGMSVDGTSSSNIEITDQMSGVTTKVTLGTDNLESKVIDGQTYYFNTVGTDYVNVTWGTGAAINNTGDFVTLFPRLKGKDGEFISFYNGTATTVNVENGTKIQLPTGAILATVVDDDAEGYLWSFTATTKEDGTASSFASGETASVNLSASGVANFHLGRTAVGGIVYNLTGTANTALTLELVGTSGTTPIAQATLQLVEEKDDAGDQKSVVISATTEDSGSNKLAIPGSPAFTDSNAQNSPLGSDSTITDYVDLWGTYIRKTTSGQDALTIHYPDEQVVANIAVLGEGATASAAGGVSGSTVKSAVPIKTSIAKLDSEVTSADRSTKSLILVGGPFVNTMVAELATAGKTRTGDFYLEQGRGYAVIDYVADAFASGRAALVVAGTSSADTRTATAQLQTFDTAGLTGARMEWKNGVVTTLPA